uniref:Nose resistant to fluoxetine protein 6-like n=1 Tax=Callorhinchus milii TaxID=7868 RepID=A0A4W3HKU0_CALMI
CVSGSLATNQTKVFKLIIPSQLISLSGGREQRELTCFTTLGKDLMYDSIGRQGSNILHGNIDQLGSYSECISARAPAGSFNGQYCKLKVQQGGIDFHVAICMPSSCKNEDVIKAEELGILKYKNRSFLSFSPMPLFRVTNATYGVKSVHCHSISPRIDMFVGVCMYVSPFSAAEVFDWMLTCFAIQKSVPSVLSTETSTGSYSVINGIRVLSLLWIISGHMCQFILFNNLDNPLEWLRTIPNNVFYIVSLGGPFYLAVDTFFLISGLLSARTLLNMSDRSREGLSFRILRDYVIKRLQRILPLYLYTMCLLIGLYSLIPWRSVGENSKSHLEKCKQSWWTNLLFLNNFISVDQHCMGWTWYLANDFQFYITTPVFIFLRRQLMVTLAGLVLLSCFMVTALISWFFKLPIGLHSDSRLISHRVYNVQYYLKPYCRYGPFLIGILLGILMHRRETPLLTTKAPVLVGWLCALLIMAVVIALGYTLDDSIASYSVVSVLYQALHRSVWAASVGWIILACEEGYGGFVRSLLSCRVWVPLANLSYACYLVHPAVIDIYNGLQETLLHYTDINMFYLFIGHTVLTHAAGFALCVLVEIPIQALRRHIRT